MANTDNPNGFRPIFAQGGNLPSVDKGSLVCSTAIAAGDALIWNSGYLDIAASTSAAITGVAAESVASTGSHVEILFYPADPNTVFIGQCSGDMTQGLVGSAVDIEGTTGIMEIDEDASTEDVARIIKIDPDSDAGTNARVWFKWALSSYDGAVGAQT